MTFRKGHKPYKSGDKYCEKTGEKKEKPIPPVISQESTLSNPHNLNSSQINFSENNITSNSSPNFSAGNTEQNNSSRNTQSNFSPNNFSKNNSQAAKPGVIEWRPHNGPQTRFHLSRAYETLFGGTKGPGKTDTLLREGLRQIHIPNYRAIIFRRTYPNLREIIDRSHKYFGGLGAKFNAQDHRWQWPNGASYAFGHVQHEHDKYNHNGHEYHYIGFDEVTEFTETQYLFLMAQNRTSDSRIRCYIRSTANPGGVGHGWVKKRFIDCLKPCELKYFKRQEDDDLECPPNDPHAVSREFIPATVYDNPSITENDPNYIKRLEQLPEEDKQALLYGNWDIFKGQFFKAWRRSIHVRDREVSKGFNKFIAIDYGYAAPSAVGWFMVDFDGNLHMYRELYKEGLTYTQLAEKIKEMTPEDEKIDYAVADPAIWGDKSHHGKDGIKGESGGETMQIEWKNFTALIKADNSRIIGWGRMRELLEPRQLPDGSFESKFTVSPNCRDFIRTVPSLIHDDKKIEDCNSDGEDHCADMTRYAIMSRAETPERMKFMPFNEIVHKIFDPFAKEETKVPTTDAGGVYQE